MAEAKGKNTMLVQLDWLEDYAELTDEQFGQLMRAYLKFGKTREATKFGSALMRLAFNQMKRFAEYTITKYEELCKRRAEYGRKGAQKKAEASTSKHKPTDESYIDIDNEYDNDIDNVVVVDNDIVVDVPLLGTVKDYFTTHNYRSDANRFFQYNVSKKWKKLNEGVTWQELADQWESVERKKGGDPGDIGFSW